MPRKGLNREAVVAAALRLMEAEGPENFSMHLLAKTLDVKTASLYAHVENLESLLTDVGLEALNLQLQTLSHAMDGTQRDERLRALSLAFRRFAKEHSALYRLIMQIPVGENEKLKDAAKIVADPWITVLSEYRLPAERKIHWQRVLRAGLHGFLAQEFYGWFSHYPVDIEESYSVAVDCFIVGLHREEAQYAR